MTTTTLTTTLRTTLPILLVSGLLVAACGGTLGPAAEQPAQPDGSWLLVEGSGPEGEVPVLADAPITLVVEGSDWGGTAACNSYGGTVAVDGAELTISELYQTEMACLDEGVMESERLYLDALRRVERFERDADRLVLRGEDVTLTYVAAGAADEGG